MCAERCLALTASKPEAEVHLQEGWEDILMPPLRYELCVKRASVVSAEALVSGRYNCKVCVNAISINVGYRYTGYSMSESSCK